jgi:hypothetical protein
MKQDLLSKEKIMQLKVDLVEFKSIRWEHKNMKTEETIRHIDKGATEGS